MKARKLNEIEVPQWAWAVWRFPTATEKFQASDTASKRYKTLISTAAIF